MKPLDQFRNAANFNIIIEIFDNEMNRLPPLKAVAAFEACYRLRSFSRAASSLNVRQPAISHQIRLLESDLGTKLFTKHGARILPTQSADEFYLAVSSGLSEIGRGSERIRKRGTDKTLTLATYPGIAAFWLLPTMARCGDDTDRPPLQVTTVDRDADMPLDAVDCSVLFGQGDWQGFESFLLAYEEVVPVAAPALAEKWRQQTPEHLVEAGPLIHLEDAERRWFTWHDWRMQRAPGAKSVNSTYTVTNHGVAMQEALLGTGIALGWINVIGGLMQHGALVPLCDQPIASDRGYHLVLAKHMAGTHKRSWLLNALGLKDQVETGPT